MKEHLFVLLVVLGLSLMACEEASSQNYTETSEESFDVASAPTLTIDNFAGNINVRAGEDGTIRVVATKRARRKQNLDKLDVDISARDDRVEISTDRPSGLQNVSVNLDVTAPADTRVTVYTGGGNVSVRDIDSIIDARTGGGNIDISAVNGDVTVNTGGGNIEIRDATGSVDADTGGGNITARDASGHIRLSTGGGNITYEGRPQGDSRLETGGGSITLRLPADAKLTVDLETGGGKIDVDFPVAGQASKQRVSGTIGGGGEGEIRAETGGGDIAVLREGD